jgi:hypothetical protein
MEYLNELLEDPYIHERKKKSDDSLRFFVVTIGEVTTRFHPAKDETRDQVYYRVISFLKELQEQGKNC